MIFFILFILCIQLPVLLGLVNRIWEIPAFVSQMSNESNASTMYNPAVLGPPRYSPLWEEVEAFVSATLQPISLVSENVSNVNPVKVSRVIFFFLHRFQTKQISKKKLFLSFNLTTFKKKYLNPNNSHICQKKISNCY